MATAYATKIQELINKGRFTRGDLLREAGGNSASTKVNQLSKDMFNMNKWQDTSTDDKAVMDKAISVYEKTMNRKNKANVTKTTKAYKKSLLAAKRYTTIYEKSRAVVEDEIKHSWVRVESKSKSNARTTDAVRENLHDIVNYVTKGKLSYIELNEVVIDLLEFIEANNAWSNDDRIQMVKDYLSGVLEPFEDFGFTKLNIPEPGSGLEFGEADITPEEFKKHAAESRVQANEYLYGKAKTGNAQDFGIPKANRKPKTKAGSGCLYKGVHIIGETENDKFYCPSSLYCYFKVLEKWIKLTGAKDAEGNDPILPIPRQGVYAYYTSKGLCKKTVLNYLCPIRPLEDQTSYKKRSDKYFIEQTPPWVHMERHPSKDNKITLTPVNKGHTVGNHTYKIGLYPASVEACHCILLKDPFATHMTQSEVNEVIVFTHSFELISDWIRLKQQPPKKKQRYVIIYDIETAVRKEEVQIGGRSKIANIHVPQALSYKLVDLDDCIYDDNSVKVECLKLYETYNVYTSLTCDYDKSDIYDKMMDEIVAKYANLIATQKNKIQIFAHNGARYDNIFAKSTLNCKLVSQIRAGSALKILKLEHIASKIEFSYKDTLPFCLQPLKDIAKTLKCNVNKIDFDIVGWTREDYEMVGDADWQNYMKYDVETLAEVFVRLEASYRTLGASLTTNLGLPGVAYDLAMAASFVFSRMYYPKDPSMIELIRNGVYGGRVICFERYFKAETEEDQLICYDANSLYPSAMYAGTYPIGKPVVINPNDYSKWMDAFQAQFVNPLLRKDGRLEIAGVKHYYLTIKFRIPNLKRTLVPIKENGMLFYPSNGIYEGTYNDVDIREMLIDNYEIISITNGIYWTESSRVFSELIGYLYDQRLKYKAEKNSMEYTYKIILNAMYGKMLEAVKTESWFVPMGKDYVPCVSAYNNERCVTHANGQVEVMRNRSVPHIEKPLQLGSYILAYSRAIMNEFIRKIGIDNVFYTDTDSIYATRRAIKASGIVETKPLCGVKNDYGEGIYITEAFFLDQKRYFLQKIDARGDDPTQGRNPGWDKGLDRNKISCKYTGLGFKDLFDRGSITNEGGENKWNQEQKDKIRSIYIELRDNYDSYCGSSKEGLDALVDDTYKLKLVMDKWKRTDTDVKIMLSEIKFIISPHKKGQYVDGKYFSLGYDFNKETSPYGMNKTSIQAWCQQEIFNPRTCSLTTNKDGLKILDSKLPLTPPTKKKSNGTIITSDTFLPSSKCNKNFQSNFYHYTCPLGFTAVLYCLRDSLHSKSLHSNSSKKSLQSKSKPNRYYTMCILGPVNEIVLTEDQIASLRPVIVVDKDPEYLNNQISWKMYEALLEHTLFTK